MTVLTAVFSDSVKQVKAKDVPLMAVYTWGDHNVYYLRIKQGSVAVASRKSTAHNGIVFTLEDSANHFDQLVEVVDAEIHILD